jgi:tetratricopeptide (TPR) repeat protein
MKRKAFAITAILLLAVFVSLPMLNQVQAESFTATWAGYAFRGTDSFYKETVVAYESESTAVLYVSVTHDYSAYSGKQINVSTVGISLNWGDTFNSTQANRTNPVSLKEGESRIFTITFEVPDPSNMSNLFRWDYEIYVEHVDATGDVVDIDIESREDLGLPYFVVYSAEQARSKQISETIDGITPLEWNSSKAGILWKKAMNETSVAEYYYELGDFSNAATHYENALSLIDGAFTAEETKGTRWEEAEIMLLESQVKWFEGLSNFYNGLTNMWTLIGVALVLFAIGYILRGLVMLRKTSAST